MRRMFPSNTFVAPQLPNPARDLVRLVVAEAPGEEEANVGQPLVGGSGRVFNNLLRSAGIPRDGLTIVNCINCRPPDNVFPTDREARSYISKEEGEKVIAHCKSAHVDPVLNGRNWNRIDLVGDKALRIVAGKTGGITKWRGSPVSFTVDNKQHRAIGIQHPSYLMRDQEMLPVAAHDLTKSLEEPPEHYKPFPSIEDVQAFHAKTLAIDIECPKYKTMGEAAPPEMVGLCAESGIAICVPLRGSYIPEIRRILLEAEQLIGHNILQFDAPKLFGFLELEW